MSYENYIFSVQTRLGNIFSLTENFSLLDEYLEKFKKLYPEDKNIESIEFDAIKNLYFSKNYNQLIPISEKFIKTYQESIYTNELEFLLGESNFMLKNYLLVAYYIII